MISTPRTKTIRVSLLLFLILFVNTSSYATWSIIAVDRNTGEIGIAGASCTFDVSGIASLIPGKGAIVVQASSNYFARIKGVDLMENNTPIVDILKAMKAKEFNPERQQYGVIILDNNSAPLVYSGTEIKDWYGSRVGDSFAVLGNILVGPNVINEAFNSFNEAKDKPFSERLMDALKAGENAGGDKRCGEQKARSAFISVYNPVLEAITNLSINGIDKGGMPAVTLLKSKFNKLNSKDKSSPMPKGNLIRSINGNEIRTADLDSFLEKQMDSLKIPGLSFAFINNSKIVYKSYLGVINIETNEKVTQKTMFDAASISKTIFSVFVLKMVDKGLIDLDMPLYKYLENPDISYDKRYRKITARMVLSHTSGFPNWRFLDKKGNYDSNAKLRIDFEPGTQFQYSGEGYQYLSEVLAHLLNINLNALQDVIKKELFDPLNMGESSFVWNNYLEKNRAKGHLNGKLNMGWSSNSNNPNFNAAASLQTNIVSFSHFLIKLMDGEILSKNEKNQLLKVQSFSISTKSSKRQEYGLGIRIDSTKYGKIYSHGGDNLSATAQYLFNIENKNGYVFFTNSEHKKTLQSNLTRFLSQHSNKE